MEVAEACKGSGFRGDRQRLCLEDRPFHGTVVGCHATASDQFYTKHVAARQHHDIELGLRIAGELLRQHDEAANARADACDGFGIGLALGGGRRRRLLAARLRSGEIARLAGADLLELPLLLELRLLLESLLLLRALLFFEFLLLELLLFLALLLFLDALVFLELLLLFDPLLLPLLALDLLVLQLFLFPLFALDLFLERNVGLRLRLGLGFRLRLRWRRRRR